MAESKKIKKKLHFTAIDMFSGCGGLSQGLKQAGFTLKAAIEIDLKAKETYELNHPNCHMYHADVRNLSPQTILSDLEMRPGELTLLAGCPPCQGFSRLRTKNKISSIADTRNDLIFEFMHFISVLKPKMVMLENVPNLASDERFNKFLEFLNEHGYYYSYDIVNAAHYGVAQRRKRLVLLASKVNKPIMAERCSIPIHVRDVIFDIESKIDDQDSIHYLKDNRSAHVINIIKNIPKDGGSRKDLPEIYQLDCHKKISGFFDVYGRMAWDDVSPTITSGCNNPSKGRFLHPEKDRVISLREAAALQGFPPHYKFNIRHGKGSIALMIGNALPPPLIEAHAKGLLDSLINQQHCYFS
ncbi:DNA cytosine methyltransferase [Candidatus Pantoea formicae]|uniref:DNA cytosine methyltransferase n=1 Tax=Candidatus Pantoea formicae TaxID=2608355 RepID=UPI003ED85EEE